MTGSEKPTLTRLDILRGLRISIWEAIWATVFAVLTTGAFQTGFALFLQAPPFALGLLAGLPAVVNLLQIPASLYVERRGERRKFVGYTALAGRLMWLPILLIPFLLPQSARVPAFLFLLALSSALMALSVPAWTSWMSDLVPATSRGQYFGQRNMLAGIVSMLAPLPAGAFLDQAVKYNRLDPKVAFAVLFAIASVAAVGSYLLILRQPEPPMPRTEGRQNPLKSLAEPFADATFRPLLVFAAATVCGQTLAAQFFTAWQVDKAALNLPYLTVQLLGAVAAGAALATTPLWGYLADKYGPRPVLMLSCIGTIIAPLLWLFTMPGAFWGNIAVIIALNVFSGAAWAGVGLTQFNMLIGLASPSARSTYVAVFSAATGIIGGISPVVGGALMGLLEPVHHNIGPLIFNNYKILFLTTALIRVGCVFLLTRVKGEGHSTRYVLEQLISARPLTSYRTVRRLSRPSGEQERRQTVEELGELRSPLAVEELVAALEDVSPEVRERAAVALGAIGDARAIRALGAKLFDPAAGIGELAAQALGQIGDPTATPFLVSATQGPDAGVRVAALKSLARIADPSAVPALIAALTPTHPTACEAAAVALASVGARVTPDQTETALPRLLYLLSQEVDRGMRFAAARALKALAPQIASYPEVFDTLAHRLLEEEDPAVLAQEVAALSRIVREAQRDHGEAVAMLVPVLDRTGSRGLAYKQTLEALADLALAPGAFYPYLGLPEMARDQSANRLLADLRRRHTAAVPENGLSDVEADHALEAFASGEYRAFFEQLGEHLASQKPYTVSMILFDGLLRRAVAGEGTMEEALLALLIIHNLWLPHR